MLARFNLKSALSGVVSAGIPFIFKGMINEWLTDQSITGKDAVQWVVQQKDLLTLFIEYGGQDSENVLQRAGNFVQDPSWCTSEWLIDAVREEHPDVASLFLGWEEGRVWLDLSSAHLREEFSRVNNPNQPEPAVAAPGLVIQAPPEIVEKAAPELKPIAGSENFSDLRSPNAPPASKRPIKGAEMF